jgi:AcrR family transcriptional regulator
MEKRRRTQAERTAATRSALVAAGRRLFATEGFAGVGTETIVREADVSRGALYHHFADKTELFAAVLEDVEREVAEHLAALAGGRAGDGAGDGAGGRAGGGAGDRAGDGFVDVLVGAVEAWLDLCDRPEVQRIVLIDGPSVLGWPRWRDICRRHVLGLIQAVLRQGIADGELAEQPVAPLSHALIAVADEAAMYVVSAEDRRAARQEMVEVARGLMRSLTQ